MINERKRGQILEETPKGSFGGKTSEECFSGMAEEEIVNLKFHLTELEKILKGNRESRSACSSSNNDYNVLSKMEVPRDYLKL